MNAIIENKQYDNISTICVENKNGMLMITPKHISIISDGILKYIVQNTIKIEFNMHGIYYYQNEIFTFIN